MKKIIAGIAVAFVMLVGGVSVAACSSPAPVVPTPATWAVSYMGTNYCPYEYTPYETQMYGYAGACTPIQFPSVSAVPVNGSLQWALMNYWTMYSDFYMSDYWYYHYYAPIGPRLGVSVSLVPYRSYMSTVSIYHATYAGQIRTNSARATWNNGKGGRTTGSYTFPTTNAKDAQKIWTNSQTRTTSSGSGFSSGSGGGTIRSGTSSTTRSGGLSTGGKAGRR